MRSTPPRHLDLDRTQGLTVTWQDGTTSFLPVALLRRASPSAEARALRETMDRNPLAVVPASDTQSLRAEDLEMVGNYAVRIRFSDGHNTGLYTWDYLRGLADSMDLPPKPEAS